MFNVNISLIAYVIYVCYMFDYHCIWSRIKTSPIQVSCLSVFYWSPFWSQVNGWQIRACRGKLPPCEASPRTYLPPCSGNNLSPPVLSPLSSLPRDLMHRSTYPCLHLGLITNGHSSNLTYTPLTRSRSQFLLSAHKSNTQLSANFSHPPLPSANPAYFGHSLVLVSSVFILLGSVT